MVRELPSLSTDQISAFVELARQGSIRKASVDLHLTEQGNPQSAPGAGASPRS